MGNYKLTPIKLDNYKPLRELVFESMREAIIGGFLKPGERLMETQLAEQMGVSRTPVREAIRKLELEGFVVMVPRKGVYVSNISVKDIADVFEVRAALEGLAAGLAAERITSEELDKLEKSLLQISESNDDDLYELVEEDKNFHELLYQASRNERLTTIITNLKDQIERFRTTSLALPGRKQNAITEHKNIVEAVSDRNIELAQALASEHIQNAEQSFLKALQEAEK
ncbi:MAG: GntR family transcriptional regulator [Clostridiales bacterium]|nr:GntR family transcriptional regulator [Clostridiales bacterium]MCF8021562.1 GntR family transcriptional regulator [Clostridiales bacterium]